MFENVEKKFILTKDLKAKRVGFSFVFLADLADVVLCLFVDSVSGSFTFHERRSN